MRLGLFVLFVKHFESYKIIILKFWKVKIHYVGWQSILLDTARPLDNRLINTSLWAFEDISLNSPCLESIFERKPSNTSNTCLRILNNRNDLKTMHEKWITNIDDYVTKIEHFKMSKLSTLQRSKTFITMVGWSDTEALEKL